MSKEIYINFLDYCLPKKIENNLSILKKNNKSKKDSLEMIKKIGIQSRNIADENITSNILAERVGKKIFSKFNKNDIDFLIYCTNSPDYILPPNSCLLQNKLKLKKNVGSFDVNLSCSGFVYSLGLAKSLIFSDQAKNILLITSDTYSRFIKKKEYKNRKIFGDGSSAAIISKKKTGLAYKINKFEYGTDGSGGQNAIFKNFGTHYLHNKKKETFDMHGPEILSFALREVPRSINIYLKNNKIKIEKIDTFIFHQANEFIIKSLQNKLNIPTSKIVIMMKKIGNTVSSSIPIALKQIEKKIKKGEKILLIGFGGGLSWGIGQIEKN